MKHIGLIGQGLKHSVSAAMQQAALDHLGLEARYEVWDTRPDEVEQRVTSLRDEDCLGANVTVPHKQAVIPFLDELDSMATRAGAVNTIVRQQGRLTGHNTDVAGFTRALTAAAFNPRGVRAAVLGAGGGARAVSLALIEGGAGLVFLSDAVSERAETLAGDLTALAPPGTAVVWSQWGDDDFRLALRACGLLVNCTPVGMRFGPAAAQPPVPAEFIPAGCLAFDLVYNPEETPFLRAARLRKARVAGGLSMLVYQGAASLTLWTGRGAPVEVMFRAARKALTSSAGG
jgi:shikimate dehydrogenase